MPEQITFCELYCRFTPERASTWTDEAGAERTDRTTRLTVAYRLEGNKATYGVAFCSPADTFDPIRGRMYALRRCMAPSKVRTVRLPAGFNNQEQISDKIIQDIEGCFRINDRGLRGMPRTWNDVSVARDIKRLFS